MSIHIAAQPGDIAPTVLLPGDPLRAGFVAERYLDGPVCYNRVRGMLGFTGTWKGRRVSVQGSGMGQPSLAIYVNELIRSYGVKRLIRVGSCGSLQPDIGLRDIVIAMSASTDSAMNAARFRGMQLAPTASPALFLEAVRAAERMGLPVRIGPILATDTFYADDPEGWRLWAEYGHLAVEMESAMLYTLASKHRVEALTILTVSDSLVTGGAIGADEREKSFTQMMELALALIAP
ncbi:MAG TPA: purine-nucleoside phosphorylase [Spirochaetia bacterium]|nr:purine-nucleoside phosphorylase [Spirochaetia bacterium]